MDEKLREKATTQKLADSYYNFTVKQGWQLADYEPEIRRESYIFADEAIQAIEPLIRKDERERIHNELADFVEACKKAPEMHGDKQLDLICYSNFVEWWQALKATEGK